MAHLRNPQSQGGLTRPRRPGQQQRSPGHLSTADQIDDETAGLAGLLLTHEARADGCGFAGGGVQAEALDVCVGRDSGCLLG